jgi:hypothetical protein
MFNASKNSDNLMNAHVNALKKNSLQHVLKKSMFTSSVIIYLPFFVIRPKILPAGNGVIFVQDMRRVYGMEDKVELEIFINHKCGLPDNPKQRLKVTF